MAVLKANSGTSSYLVLNDSADDKLNLHRDYCESDIDMEESDDYLSD